MATSRSDDELRNIAGWDLPLKHENTNCCHKSTAASLEPLTMREIAMMGLVNSITDKPDWPRKVFDEEIVNKWRAEVVTSDDNSSELITSEIFDWCITEVRDKADIYGQKWFVHIFDAEYSAAKSDAIVSEDLRQELKSACQPLLDVSESLKDYHPGSDGQVLNLIHPSLFPLIYGKSRVLESGTVPLRECSTAISKGKIAPVPPEEDKKRWPWEQFEDSFWSRKYQWLPSSVQFDGDGKARISSYVNNLHPVGNEALYAALEKFVDRAVPMWNDCLPFGRKIMGTSRIRCDGGDVFDPPEPDWNWKPEGDDKARNENEDDRESDASEYNDPESHWQRTRRIVLPRPVAYEELNRPRMSDFDLREHREGLQIIFKLASIELSPDKPRYKGGSWHVEGQHNERIAATAIYYYDCENISESLLSFRHQWCHDADLNYAQDDHDGIFEVFGLEDREGEAVQVLGSATTKQGRMLVFPNNYQHQVQPFELEDKSKPGYRRFLVMWLVDPWNRVLSTANVPPQQREWWIQELLRSQSFPLPTEVVKMVGDSVDDFPISLEQAKEHRLELMKERTVFHGAVESAVSRYNLCEH